MFFRVRVSDLDSNQTLGSILTKFPKQVLLGTKSWSIMLMGKFPDPISKLRPFKIYLKPTRRVFFLFSET